MEREEMIEALCGNLWAMNRWRIGVNGQTEEGLSNFIEDERERYEEMSDLQLQNLVLINC